MTTVEPVQENISGPEQMGNAAHTQIFGGGGMIGEGAKYTAHTTHAQHTRNLRHEQQQCKYLTHDKQIWIY